MAGHFFPGDLYFYDRWRTDLLVPGIISAIYVQIASHREMRAESVWDRMGKGMQYFNWQTLCEHFKFWISKSLITF